MAKRHLQSPVALLLAAAILWLLLFPSCGASSGAQTPGALAPAADDVERLTSGGFTADVLPETYLGGGSVTALQLSQAGRGGELLVTLQATGAQGLKGVFVELHYDAQRWHPVAANPAVALTASPELLRLDVLSDPGVVSCGQVIATYEGSNGVSGNLDLLEVRFAPGPAGTAHRASAPPATGLSAAQLFYSAADGLYWYFTSGGDYNQDGQVAIGDLAPLGLKFGEVSPGGPGADFPVDDWRDLIDGSRDGAINLPDLTPIGANWGARTLGYHVVSSLDVGDFPAGNTTADGAGAAQLGDVLLADATAAAGERKKFAFALPAPDPAAYFWVRPYDGTGPGTPSPARQPGQLDTAPPFWVDVAFTGIQAAFVKDGAVRVMYGAADDNLSPPIDYTIYYNEGATVDFDTAQTFVVTDQSQVVDVTGLSNGQQYAFAVRASDRAAIPNEEQNTVVLTATPLPVTDLPLVIAADTEFPGPVMIPDGQTTTVENGADIICHSDLVIDGILSAYDADIDLVVDGDFTLNGQIVLDGPDDDLPDGTEGHHVNIVAQMNMTLNDTGVISPKGNLQIVDEPGDLQTPDEIQADTEADQNPELYPFNVMPDDGSPGFSRVANVTRGASGTKYYGPQPWDWIARGNWGQVPTPPRGVDKIVLRLFQRNGKLQFQDFNITGPTGRSGRPGTGCTATGGKGQDAFMLRVHCDNQMTFNNVTINLGDGGDGGTATAGPCCDAVATGGDGGKPGKFRFTAGNEIRILGTFDLNPGKGGAGGLATATGEDGDPGCPGEPGCNGTATGGNGADTFFGIRVRGNVNGIGNVMLGPALGGDGGAATAFGGAGGATTCPCADGAPGGNGTATGGKGGNATFGTLAGAGGGGATGGTGGEATAFGGDGSDGTDCFKAQAGNGGDGGTADATGGQGGTASGNGPLTDGPQGPGTAVGGAGGDGGDGCPPGGGGAGGTATADGDPADQLDGPDGSPGVEWPVGCVLWLCIDPETLVPDPATPGPIPHMFSGMADVQRMDTMEVIGQVQFQWHDQSGGHLFWSRGADDQVVLCISNNISTSNAGITFSLFALEWNLEPLILTGARLGVRYAEGPVDAGAQVALDGDFQLLGSVPITLVPNTPTGPPVHQEFPIDSFFDVFYRIDVPPTCSVFVDEICIRDP